VLVQRALAIAAVALLGGVAALSIAEQRAGSTAPSRTLPQPVGRPGGGWYPALAGVRPKPPAHHRSACGYVVVRSTLGVGNPVLPCGAKIFLAFGRKRVLTQVIDRGPSSPGREFDLTPALARLIHLRGVQAIRWAYARP
jgi:hypothetical protein